MKRITSLLLAALLIAGVAVTPAVAASESAEPPTEVFLAPEQIDENTFCYRDENGDIFAYWENLTEKEYPLTRAQNGDQIYWTLAADEYEHGDYYFSTVDGVSVMVDIDSSNRQANAYLGTYNGRANKYSWLNTPSTTGFHTKLTFTGSVSLTIAIKNSGPRPSTFDGYYATME